MATGSSIVTIIRLRITETLKGMYGSRKSQDVKRRILRAEEKAKQDVKDGIRAGIGKMTLNEMFEIYFSTKRNLKQSTRTNYRYMWGKYAGETIGKKKLCVIKKSDVLHFYNDLLDAGFKPNSLEIMNTILHPTFQMAVDDGYIRLNPSAGCMAEIKKSYDWTKSKRHALTIGQQQAFINKKQC